MSRRGPKQLQVVQHKSRAQQQQQHYKHHNLLTRRKVCAEQESVPPTFDRLTDIISLVTPKTSFETTDIIYESVFLNLTRMNEEDWRLRSFVLWFPPLAWVSKEELALAGFYYSGRGDTVVCFSCTTRLNNWKLDDVPWSEHKRHSPNCKLVNGQELSNVPLDSKLKDPMIFKQNLDETTTRLQEFLKSEAEKKSNAEANNGALGSHSFAYESSSAATELKDGGLKDQLHQKQTQKERDNFDPIKAVAAAIHFPNIQDSPLIPRSSNEELPSGHSLREDGISEGDNDLERDDGDEEHSHSSESAQLQSVSARRRAKYMSTSAARSIMMLDYSEEVIYQAVKRLRRKREKVTYNSLFDTLTTILPEDSQDIPSDDDYLSEEEEKLQSLRDENKKLRNSTVCRVCNTAKVDTLFLPCRHLVCCAECADPINDCPYCGQQIVGTVKTYFG